MAVRSRPYLAHEDFDRLTALVVGAWRRRGPFVSFHVGDLCWRMFLDSTFDPAKRIHVWEDSLGHVLGFAWFYPPGEIDVLLHPTHWSEGMAQQMLAWAEHEREQALRGRGPAGAPTAWALESDAKWIALLKRSGYRRRTGCFLFMLRQLADPIDQPKVPEGFSLRPIAGETEVPRRLATGRRAFGSSPLTVESYLKVMKSPAYRPDMDLVVAAPDGTVAAFCICWLDAENHVGELEPVGTHPDYRRKGLARAVVLEGLRRLKAHGARTAIVYARNTNQASTGLYERAGFHTFTRYWRYSKEG